MNTQTKIARTIHNKGGDYTMSLKDNHKTFRQEIAAYFHKVSRGDPSRIAFMTRWMAVMVGGSGAPAGRCR